MAINFFSENIEKPGLKFAGIKKWIVSELKIENLEVGNINYVFCSDEFLLEMNREHLGHDYYTDIITFDYREGNIVSGEMYISVDRIKENSVLLGTGESEIYRVIIHGILHLCGLEDDTEDESLAMRQREDEALRRLELI